MGVECPRAIRDETNAIRATIEADAGVAVDLTYLAPTRERPRSLAYTPIDGTPETTAVADPRLVHVHDPRGEEDLFSLDESGFAVVRHSSSVTNFQDDPQIRGTC
jgi:hypothetical protein